MIIDLRVTALDKTVREHYFTTQTVRLKQTRLNSWSSYIIELEHLAICSLIRQFKKQKWQ